MQKLVNKARYVMTGEDGASNLEIIVWMSVVLVIAGFLFVFRDKISSFVQSASNKVDGMQQVMDNRFDDGASGNLTPIH